MSQRQTMHSTEDTNTNIHFSPKSLNKFTVFNVSFLHYLFKWQITPVFNVRKGPWLNEKMTHDDDNLILCFSSGNKTLICHQPVYPYLILPTPSLETVIFTASSLLLSTGESIP